jgi:cell division protein FtsB
VILRELRRRAQKYLLQSLLLCLMLYFIYHLFQGGRGVMTLNSLETFLQHATQDYDSIKKEHDRLARRVDLMKPGAVDPDLLEEEAKKALGVKHPNEYVVLPEERSRKNL